MTNDLMTTDSNHEITSYKTEDARVFGFNASIKSRFAIIEKWTTMCLFGRITRRKNYKCNFMCQKSQKRIFFPDNDEGEDAESEVPHQLFNVNKAYSFRATELCGGIGTIKWDL